MTMPWTKLWEQWLARRTQRTDRIQFTQRNVYIVPSMGGWVYAAAVLVLLLAAINEQLNLAYALAFLLGGVGLSSMSLTHGNLRGLVLTLGHSERAHAGQSAHVTVQLDAKHLQQGRYGLVFNEQLPCEVEADSISTIQIEVACKNRGWMTLPRWQIQTTYPLGLFRAWAYWRPEQRLLIWPALESHPPMPPNSIGTDEKEARQADTVSTETSEDDIRAWRRGDALHDVMWKKSATRLMTEQPPLVRGHQAAASPPKNNWFDWDMTAGLPTEARLSRLATWLVDAEKTNVARNTRYGLRMPNTEIPCGAGPAHLTLCLDTLALWPAPPSQTS